MRDQRTNVYYCPVFEIPPGKVINYMREFISRALGKRPHGVSKSAGALWELGKDLVDGVFGVVC